MKTTLEKIKELHLKLDCMSDYEKKFIQDNHERFEKYGDETRVSEKQEAMVNRIFKERVEEGKPHTAKGEEE